MTQWLSLRNLNLHSPVHLYIGRHRGISKKEIAYPGNGGTYLHASGRIVLPGGSCKRREGTMKRFMRLPGVCITAALSIGLGTLAGCRSTDVASPSMGHVAKFTMEFNWPPRTATRPESDAVAPASLLASLPAKGPPAASTQPLAAPAGGTGPAALQPPYCQPVAAAQGLPPAPVMELASRTAAADPAPDSSPPRFVLEPVSNDPPTVSDATKPVLSSLASALIASA